VRDIAAHVETLDKTIVGGLATLRLTSPALASARAGQWAALRQPDALDILARPYPLTRLRAREGTVDVLYRPDDRSAASRWLRTLHGGETVHLLGPWGRPFAIEPRTRHALLLGTGERLCTLLALAETLTESGVSVVVAHDAPTAGDLLPPSLAPAAVEIHLATEDGSAGVRGDALMLAEPLLAWADAVYAALPPARYLALRDLIGRLRLRPRRGFATVVAEAPYACYAAACDGCAVTLRNGTSALLCRDGPALDLLDVA